MPNDDNNNLTYRQRYLDDYLNSDEDENEGEGNRIWARDIDDDPNEFFGVALAQNNAVAAIDAAFVGVQVLGAAIGAATLEDRPTPSISMDSFVHETRRSMARTIAQNSNDHVYALGMFVSTGVVIGTYGFLYGAVSPLTSIDSIFVESDLLISESNNNVTTSDHRVSREEPLYFVL